MGLTIPEQRHCCDCGRPIINCNGFVHAGDFLKALGGALLMKKVRERCGVCVEIASRELDQKAA